ncbi:hypothetical protein JCM33374_g6503 [Metschnikowia sp. JCM 33374]|nr:hypothetical protein JCM33374_g6503 [Metschnikowia sp. JCM 33374]
MKDRRINQNMMEFFTMLQLIKGGSDQSSSEYPSILMADFTKAFDRISKLFHHWRSKNAREFLKMHEEANKSGNPKENILDTTIPDGFTNSPPPSPKSKSKSESQLVNHLTPIAAMHTSKKVFPSISSGLIYHLMSVSTFLHKE